MSDDAQGLTAFGVALTDQGFEIQLCRTTTEAATLVTNTEVGVLLVDCASIPVADGLQLAQDCRARHSRLRCLVICDAPCAADYDQIASRVRDIDPSNDWLQVLRRPYSMVRFATTMKEIIARQHT